MTDLTGHLPIYDSKHSIVGLIFYELDQFIFTLSFAEFVSLGSSSNAASEVGERNASLSVNNSLEVSLGSFDVKSSKSSDNFEGVLEVNSKVGS